MTAIIDLKTKTNARAPESQTADVDVSVVIPFNGKFDDITSLHREYRSGIEVAAESFEFLYVLVQNSPALPALRRLQEEGEPIKLITFAKWAGESGALSAGFARASGQVIVTLPSEYQVDASHIGDVIRALEGCDMAIARRHPRKRSGLGTMQQRIFNSMLQRFADAPFRDISCDVRAMKRVVAEELVLYGEQYRFLPLLAQGQGFSVQEVEIPPSEKVPAARSIPSENTCGPCSMFCRSSSSSSSRANRCASSE